MEHDKLPDKADRGRKMIAPVIITALIAAYNFFIAIVFLVFPELPILLRLTAAVIAASLIGVLFYVLYERIHEIRSGEEDDLSKY